MWYEVFVTAVFEVSISRQSTRVLLVVSAQQSHLVRLEMKVSIQTTLFHLMLTLTLSTALYLMLFYS